MFANFSVCSRRRSEMEPCPATKLRMRMQKEIIQSSRILIVDDQPQNVLLLERTLQGAGYRYLASVTDSRKVLGTFTEFHPDLVAMDLRMPHVDGFELLREIRSLVPAGTFVHVLVFTPDKYLKANTYDQSLESMAFLLKHIDIS